MNQTVNQRHLESSIGKHIAPIGKRLVGDHDRALGLLTPVHQIEQQIGMPVKYDK